MRVSILVCRLKGYTHSSGIEKKKEEINLRWQLVNLPRVKVKRFYSGTRVTQCETVSKKSKMIYSALGSVLSHDLGSHNIHRGPAGRNRRPSLCFNATVDSVQGLSSVLFVNTGPSTE